MKDRFDSLVDEMGPAEIMAWLSRFKEHGLRLRFTVEMVVKDEGRKILGKVVGIWVDYKNKREFRVLTASFYHSKAHLGHILRDVDSKKGHVPHS